MKALLAALLLCVPLGLAAELAPDGGDGITRGSTNDAVIMTSVAAVSSALNASVKPSDPIQDIKRALVPFDILKGNFEQVKTITILKKPLRSQGSFSLAKGKGLIWKVAKPIPSLLVITRDDIANIKDGSKTVFVSMKDQPALRVIGKILFAVFAADIDELQKHFQVSSAACNAGVWDVTLKPIDPGVARAVSEIQIHGSKTVRWLKLNEANGDRTRIEFLDATEKEPLSKEEEALFE